MENPNPTPCSTEHDFALVLSGVNNLGQDVMDALFVAGCDDATPSLRSGVVYLTFSRLAPDLKSAVLTAIRDVKRAEIGAEVLRVDICNLVTLAEIGRRIGRSRQLVHQYMVGKQGAGGFPPPVCQISDSTSLWAWCEVAFWLRRNNMIREEQLMEAIYIDAINSVLEYQHQRKVNLGLTEEVLESLCHPA